MSPFELPDHVERVVLGSQKVAITQTVPGEFMRRYTRFEEERDATRDRMVYHLSAYVRSENLPPEQIRETRTLDCTAPASWWQMWKRDVAATTRGLRWITRRWPVRIAKQRHTLTVTVDLRRFRLYPDAPNIGGLSGFSVNVAHHDLDVVARWATEAMP